jgi:hypothetical protein
VGAPVTTPAQEVRRWMIALGAPLALAGASVSVAFATSGGAGWTDWFFAPAVLLAPAWITLLAFLALSSDTSGRSAVLLEFTPLAESDEAELRKAA